MEKRVDCHQEYNPGKEIVYDYSSLVWDDRLAKKTWHIEHEM